MKFYISSHSKEEAGKLSDFIASCGHKVVSTWHQSVGEIARSASMSQEEKEAVSVRNFPLIEECDCLILISSEEKVPGGKFVESGYAFAKGKKVIVLGRKENLMLYHPSIELATDINDLKDRFLAIKQG